jgi:type I restriction enzyme S subunit
MMKYETYKPSEIDWLGLVPEDWVTRRTKDVMKSFIGGGTPSTDKTEYWDGLIPWVSAKDMKFDRISETIDHVNELGIRESSSNLIKSNSILFVARSGILKHTFPVAINIVPVAINQDLKAIEPNKLVSVGFLAYSFKGLSAKILMQCQKVGATVDSIEIQEFLNFQIAIPPLSEQTAIAEYLDAKTQAIDKKINLLTKKAETYKELRKSIINDAVCKGLDKNVKLKESEVGIMPIHWQIKRLKDRFNSYTGNSISDKGEYEVKENSRFYVSTKDIDLETGKIDYDNGTYIQLTDKSFKVAKSNSVLLCLEGANAGKKIGFTDKDICFVNKLCCIKGKETTVDNKYLYYYLLSECFKVQFFAVLNGMIGGVSLSILKNFTVILPPKEEQTAIANYLDEKTQKIDAIVSNIGKQIDTLKELRKTLINDVVTGKIKVSEPLIDID